MSNFFQRLKHFQPQIFPLLSGLLVATSYPPFSSWAVTFCWVPLWFSLIDEESPRKAFWKAWITQFTLSMIGFHWIAYTAHSFGFLPWPVALLSLLLFCSLAHLHIPVSLMLAKWVDNRTHGLASAPVFFFLCALIQGLVERFWPMIFPWHLGYSVLFSRLEVSQLAEYVGFQGLSSLFLLINAILASGISYLKESNKKAYLTLGFGVALFFVLNIWGAIIHPKIETQQKSITALIVQANIGQFEKVAGDLGNQNLSSQDGQLQEAVLKKYIDLTEEGLSAHPETELIVWPETALPDYYDIEFLSGQRQLKLRDQVAKWNRALITGAYSRDLKTQKVFNALFVFNDKGELAAPAYRKSELLAFGEYLPLGETFPFLYKLLPFVSSFGRGPGPEVKAFTIKDKKFQFAPQICYESLYDSFARRGAELKPDFLVNITNDSWFGTRFEPVQHGTMNWARALETRRPLIRSTNTGQSSIVLQDGTILLRSPLEQEWYGSAQIPLPENKETFFMQWGHYDWVLYALLLLILIGRLRRLHV